MKKILGLAISVLMILTLCACEKKTDESSGTIVVQDPTLKKVGTILKDEFVDMVSENPNMSAQEIADALLANEVITFKGMATPVENGLLTGFGGYEVNEFKEGVMFGPVIGSIPFVGYIFNLEEDQDILTFMACLNNNADKRWNVCTEADSVDMINVGYTVFFLMSPDKLENEGNSMEEDENSLIEQAEKEREKEELDSAAEEAEKERAELESMEEEAVRLIEEAEKKEEFDSMEDEAANKFVEEAEKKLQEMDSIVEEAKKSKEE